MKRGIARLLVIVLLANLFGLASAEAAPDSDLNDSAAAYFQDGDSDKIPHVLGCCCYACHVACHFVGLIAAPLVLPDSLDERQLALSDAPVFATPAAAPFRPPRSLS